MHLTEDLSSPNEVVFCTHMQSDVGEKGQFPYSQIYFTNPRDHGG